MSTISRPQSATPSALGYYYQGLYALVVLCDASDNAAVSIETDDDVVLTDEVNRLIQLKHSLEDKPPLSVTDVGLWKALRNWNGRPHDGTEQFIFVTRASVPDTSVLSPLLTEGSDRRRLLKAMVDEANRVKLERDAAEKAGKTTLPHQSRAKGCAAFLGLTSQRQQELVNLIRVLPESCTAHDIPDLLSKRLGNLLMPIIRSAIIERLIQWWDREIVLSLLDKRPRAIEKQELQSTLNRFVIEHGEENLPDDFSPLKPSGIEDGVGRAMAKQIEWVKGGVSRLNRAALARWRARSQREAWIHYDISIVNELRRYDEHLVESWKERFEPAREDCKGSDDAALCNMGLGLLDWSHLNAPNDIRPIRRLWAHAYLVQGSYQQLAEQGDVGWHPDYEERYKEMKEAD
jgi:hypothetical protein